MILTKKRGEDNKYSELYDANKIIITITIKIKIKRDDDAVDLLY